MKNFLFLTTLLFSIHTLSAHGPLEADHIKGRACTKCSDLRGELAGFFLASVYTVGLADAFSGVLTDFSNVISEYNLYCTSCDTTGEITSQFCSHCGNDLYGEDAAFFVEKR